MTPLGTIFLPVNPLPFLQVHYSYPSVSEVVGAFRGREALEQRADAFPSCFDATFCGFAQQCLELDEDLLNWIEVGTIGQQEEQLGAAARMACPARPSAWPPRCRSTGIAATTSLRSPRSPQTDRRPHDMTGRSPPPLPRAHADRESKLVPLGLASNPAHILKHIRAPVGISPIQSTANVL